MSKPSFFLLLLWVAFLAAVAISLQPGSGWSGNVRGEIGHEARAEIVSLGDDIHQVRAQAESVPNQFRVLWDDASGEFRSLANDLTVDVRMAARRISTLIRNT